MTSTIHDTDPVTLELMTAYYAQMSPAEKLRRVRQLTLAVNRLALAGLRIRHPDLDEAELLRRLALQRLGEDAFASAYTPALDRDGA